LIIVNDKDTCKIYGAYFQDTGYCTNGHLRLTLENIKKYYHKIDQYGFRKSRYSIWSNGTYAVVIHDNDSELVSVFNLKDSEYLWLDEKTRRGLEILMQSDAAGG